MDGPRDYHTKRSQRLISYNFTHGESNFFFKKLQTNLFTKQKQTYRQQKQTYGYQRENMEEGDKSELEMNTCTPLHMR